MGAGRDAGGAGDLDGVPVHFTDGRQETFDLVVGADGAWSRTRPAVSPVTPHYTGVTLVETSLADVDTRHPGLARLIGDGSLAVYGVNRALVAQRGSGGHVKVYAQFRAPLDRDANRDPADAEAVRSSLLALFDGWAAPVLDLLRHGTAFARRPLHVLPVSHTWPHVRGVTLLGDAAHLMPPLGRARTSRCWRAPNSPRPSPPPAPETWTARSAPSRNGCGHGPAGGRGSRRTVWNAS